VPERFRLLVVGKGGAPWADAAVADWAKRIARLGGVAEVAVKPEPFRGDVEAVRDAEAERLLARVGPRERLVALDERGEDLDTPAFTQLIDEGRRDAALVFALGGPYGHGAAVRSRAWRVVRLSALVLNHEVARVVWYEQLYRSLSLLAGSPYHH
jgi:23S rRNA (pseudouridine1915-N3)-methyltransferase